MEEERVMRFYVMLVSFFGLVMFSLTAGANPKASITIGVKSENLRFGGGRIVSDNPVLVSSGQVNYEDGLYFRYWGTAGIEELDDELNVGIGIIKPCLGNLKCKAEVMYWILPELDQNKGDLINLALEVSGSETFSNGTSVGFALRAEELLVFAKPDTQLFRANGHISIPVDGVSVRLSGEYAYNLRRHWHHMPLSLSATFTPGWLPEGVSITPSVEVLVPLNDRENREVGVAFGVNFTKTW